VVCVGGQGLPVASAGPDLTAISRGTVRLDGTASFDPDFGPLTFRWRQTAGPAVTLSDPTAARPTFVAPLVLMGGPPTTLTFELAVSDGAATATDTVDVVVQPAGDQVTITAATFRTTRSILTVTATSNDPTRQAVLTVQGFGTMTNNGNGTYTFMAIGQTNPETVLVISSLGGSATASVVVR
jgi:chitinase